MRLVIDMQGAQTESRFRGIGRYSLAFVQAIARNARSHELVLALSDLFPETVEPIRAAFDGLIPQDRILVWSAPGPVREADEANRSRRRIAERIREGFLLALNPDVIHVTSFFEGFLDDAVTSIGQFDEQTPVSVPLYDLIPLVNPEAYLTPDHRYERFYRRKVEELSRASLLLAISESSRREALDHVPGLNCPVVNVSTATDGGFRPIPLDPDSAAQLRRRFGIRRDFALYTGGADVRKNLPRLIEAYAGLPAGLRARVQLVLAGRMPEGATKQLTTLAASLRLPADALVLTGYVPDETLIALYNACTVFVFPSWHEGFGLPALEAMRCGAPVIGADASSIPEVIGSSGLFDPFNVDALRDMLRRVLEDPEFRTALAAHGLERAERFSWDRTAQRAVAAFEQIHDARKPARPHRDSNSVLGTLIPAVAQCCDTSVGYAETTAIAQAMARIHEPGRTARIFVDVSELCQRDAGTGIQRVTRSILKALCSSPPAGFLIEPVYATTDQVGYRYANRFISTLINARRRESEEDLPIDFYAGDVFVGLDLQHHVVTSQAAYLDTLHRSGVFVAFVVYDLLPITLPQAFPAGAEEGHRAWLDIVTRFDSALCISGTVAAELEDWVADHRPGRLRPLQIRAFRLGTEAPASEGPAAVPHEALEVLQATQRGPVFLTVGTLEPRKGHEQILQAFELLWQRGVPATWVIVGREGWMVNRLCEALRNHRELGRRLFWLEGASDACLAHLYRSASCLIAASAGEGFGLPLVEAARYRLPILARDIPVFREVAANHALYFNGFLPDDLAAAISHWLELYQTGEHPPSEGLPLLTWEQSANQMLETLLDVIGSSNARVRTYANGLGSPA